MRLRLFFLITLSVLALSAAPVQSPAQEAPTAVAGVRFDYPGELPDGVEGLAAIAPGEPLSHKKVRDGIRLLYLKGLFENISVEGEDTPGGVVLTYRLTPRVRVTDISINGNDELSRRAIKGKMAIKEGDFLDASLIVRSVETVKKLYEESGFRDALITVASEKTAPLEARLDVNITEGPPTLVRQVTITGEPALPEDALLKKIKTKPGRVLAKEDIEKSVAAVEELLLKNDYVRAEVEGPRISYFDSGASLDYAVHAGPRLMVAFEGNKAFSDRKLRKTLTFWEDKDASEETVSENLDKLKEYYVREGFYFAGVTSRTEETSAPPVVTVTFIVNEGPRVKLKDIIISGNAEVAAGEILGVMELRKSSFFRSRRITGELVDADIERIKALYESKGFLRAEAASRDIEFGNGDTEAALKLEITEGPRTYVSGVKVEGVSGVPEDIIMAAIQEKQGGPFNPQQIRDDQANILNIYSQRGFIHAGVEVEREMSQDERSVGLTYKISEGPKVTVGKIIIKGNADTKDRAIRRELLVKEGEPLDYEKVLRSQQRIYKLGFFSQARIQPVEPEKAESVKDMLVTVKERNAGAVEFGVGYGDYDKARGFAEVSYRNLFGLAHRVSARGELSFKETKGILSYKWPWFLDYPLDYRASFIYLDAEKPNYRITDFIGITGFDKMFGEHITTSLNYQYERLKLGTVRKGAELAPEDRKRSNLASIVPSAVFDYRDNPFNPKRGSMHAFVLKYASKSLGSTVDFMKFTGQTSWYFPAHKNITFAVSARGGIEGWFRGRFEVPISERFFLGGASTLRGYSFESVAPRTKNGAPAGGDSMALFNAEARFTLPYNFGLVAFLDAGNVWLLNTDVDVQGFVQTGSNGLRYGAGAGLRYDTPVGPVRLDYGYKLRRFPGESPGELHFTVGQAF